MSIFQTKKKKIKAYLDGKAAGTLSAFDLLLQDYLSGAFAEKLAECGVSHMEIHIDWLDHYKCIDVQGLVRDWISIQITPEEYSIRMNVESEDEWEPDEYPLESAEGFYEAFRERCIEVG